MISASNTPLVGHTGFIQRHSEASFGDSTKTFGQVLKALFANNEQGFALDYYDYSTLYQDAAGTIPVTAATQPMGLVLDKSKGLVLGGELFSGAIAFNTWTKTAAVISASGNTFTTNALGGCIKNPIAVGMSPTKSYQVRIVGTCTVTHKIRSSSSAIGEVSVTAGAFDVTLKSPITFSDSTMYFQLQSAGTMTVNSISIKELAGNHAYQTTSAMRPLLRDTPRRVDYDGIDDKLLVNLPSALTNCTIVCATPFVGVGVETGVTTGTTFTLDRDSCATLLINRALTSKELSDVTRVFENLLRVSRMKYLIQAMFANNEQGFAYDMEDITPEKVKWRRNLFTESEFRNGLTDAPTRGGSLTPASLAGFTSGIQLDYNAGSSYLYKHAQVKVGSSCKLSIYVEMLDGSVPRVGTASNDSSIDFSMVGETSAIPPTEVISLGGGVYRVVANRVATGSSNSWGVVKYAGNSNKSFKVTGYQLEYGNLTDYQPITDFKTEFLKAFPQHVLYQDAAGTIPALLPSDPVALFKDKSGRNNHAYQLNSTSRPLLGRHPVGGARNLLTYSGTVTDASWPFNGATKTGGQLDSDGGYTATKLTGPSIGVPAKQATATVAGPYTYTIRAKAGVSNTGTFLIRNQTTATNFSICIVNLTTGVITSGTGWTSKAAPNGFWELSYTQTTGISINDTLHIYFGSSGAVDATFDIIVDYAQLEAGSIATPFQETTTLLDITERGKADAWYLKYDGIDDYLQTSSIDFTATDKVSLFAGVRKLSDITGMLVELSPDSNTTNGTFYLVSGSNGSIGYSTKSRGTTTSPEGQASALVVGVDSSVLSATHSISGDKTTLRRNGLNSPDALGDKGAGKFSNNPLYIGRRGGTALPFNGQHYSMIGVGRLSPDAELTQVERALAPSVGVNM